jgi:DNA polymerase
LWPGQFSNNCTQGTAACLLRHALTQIDSDGNYEVILSTHDELLVVADEDDAQNAADYLCEVMRTPPDWADGLPLAVEATQDSYYTKVHG